MKETLYKTSQYFPKPYEPIGGHVNLKLDLSNYTTKADLKIAAGLIRLIQDENQTQLT